jgi:hypothetical protein
MEWDEYRLILWWRRSLFDDENCSGQVDQDESEMTASKESIPKIEPFGADELREIMVERRRQVPVS